MMSNIGAQELLVVPKLLAEGQSLCLLPYVRPIQGFFRLIATYASNGERTIAVFIENEADTLKTGFLTIGDEQKAELNRQLDQLNFKNEGIATLQLGLMIVDKPVEGYKYFTEDVPAIEVPAGGSVTDEVKASDAAPAAAPAVAAVVAAATPVALDSVIGDTAP